MWLLNFPSKFIYWKESLQTVKNSLVPSTAMFYLESMSSFIRESLDIVLGTWHPMTIKSHLWPWGAYKLVRKTNMWVNSYEMRWSMQSWQKKKKNRSCEEGCWFLSFPGKEKSHQERNLNEGFIIKSQQMERWERNRPSWGKAQRVGTWINSSVQ